MSSPKPLGVFWDINDCFIPLMLTTNECIKHLRNFISNHFNYNCIEYQFRCVFDPNLINHSIIQSLNENGCEVLDVDSYSEVNVFVKLDQTIKEFVDNYGFDTIVVLISNNCYLNSTIVSIQHKEVSVLLISSQTPNEILTNWIPFDDVFQLDRTVTLSLTNIPKDKSRKTIRDSFIPFCQQFNCKFRFNRKDSVRLDFDNANDAIRAQHRLNELEFFGHELIIEVIENEDNRFDNSLSVSSSVSSLVSVPSIKEPIVFPQNDDKCKSVIIGLYTKSNQNVFKFVQNLVEDWNDSSVNASMILRVNRERDFIGRDGRASLIVTAIDRQSNQKLMSVAKKLFVDKQQKHYWNRLQRSPKNSPKKYSNDSNVVQNCSQIIDKIVFKQNVNTNTNDCKSVITGLWTRHNDNVLKTVRNLVKSWNIYWFDIRHIVCVERSNRFNGKDGKAPLIVSTDSADNCSIILRFVSQKLESKSKFRWEALSTQQTDESLEIQSRERCLSLTSNSSYASILSKPLVIENTENSVKSLSPHQRFDLIMETKYRRRNINSRCHCQ